MTETNEYNNKDNTEYTSTTTYTYGLMSMPEQAPSVESIRMFINNIFKKEAIENYSELLEAEAPHNVLHVERSRLKEDFFTVLIEHLKNPTKQLSTAKKSLFDFIKLEAKATYGYYMNPVQIRLLNFYRKDFKIEHESGLLHYFKINKEELKEKESTDAQQDPENNQNIANLTKEKVSEAFKKLSK